MIRALKPGDFDAVWRLSEPYRDVRLKADRKEARHSFQYALAANSHAVCSVNDGEMTGAVIVTTRKNPYARKSHGAFELWLGGLELVDSAVDWWESRPVMRYLAIQFPCVVRPGMGRALRVRGFDREGDFSILWR